MRLAACMLFAAFLLPAQASDEKDALAVVQKVFDGIAAHDGAMIRSTMLPDGRIYSARDAGAPTVSTANDLANAIEANKSQLVERFTSTPRVVVHGRIAQVWGEYEFLRDGKVNHCGVDSADLFKTPDGWKIATIVYTTETTGCKGQ